MLSTMYIQTSIRIWIRVGARINKSNCLFLFFLSNYCAKLWKELQRRLWIIFDQWPKLHLGLDALSNQKILKGMSKYLFKDVGTTGQLALLNYWKADKMWFLQSYFHSGPYLYLVWYKVFSIFLVIIDTRVTFTNSMLIFFNTF